MDTFDVLVPHYAGLEAWNAIEGRLESGEVTIRQALQAEAGLISAPFHAAARVLEQRVHFDESFQQFVDACRLRDMPVAVVSSGLEAVIARAFTRYGITGVTVIANALKIGPDCWQVEFRDAGANGTDKAALVRDAKGRGCQTVFVGDGRSDYEAAAIADRRFARAGRSLEAFLQRERIAFEVFETFSDVTRALFRSAS